MRGRNMFAEKNTMKQFILITLVFCKFTYLKAQGISIEDNILSATIGIGDVTSAFNVSTPGIGVRFEKCLWQAGEHGIMSIGGIAGIKSYSSLNGYTQYYLDSKFTLTQIGGIVVYHYTGIENAKWDVYAGAGFTINILTWKLTDADGFSASASTALIGIPIYAGARYFFTNHFAVMGEVGFGLTNITAGISYKF